MATSNSDRISSAKLSTFASKLWTKVKNTFLKKDGSNGTDSGVSALINKLTTDSSTPVDGDYYVSQYVNGGTSTTSFHRRPVSALWSYIKGKMTSDSGVNISGNSATSDYVKILNTNEVNFKNVPTSGNKQRIWFNYRNGDTGARDSGNKITDYYFGNRDASTDGVSLHADTFVGNSTSATTAKKSNNSNWALWDASDSSSGGSYELSSDVLDNYSNINLINGNNHPESPYIVNSSRCENSKVYRFALWSGGIIRFKNTRGAGNVIYFRLDGSTGTINNGEYVDASAREGSIVTVFYSGNVVFIFTQNNSDSIFDVSNDSPSKVYASWSKNGCSKVSRTGGSTYQNSKYLGAMYTDSRSRINIGYVDVNNVEVGNSYKWNGFTMSLGADVDSSTGGAIFFV